MTDHTYTRLHELHGDTLQFDLRSKAGEMIEAARGEASGRAAQTLAKEDQLRLVIMGFTAGSFMHEHSTEGPALIQVLEGLVSLSTADDSLDLQEGGAVVFGAGIVHSVVAKADSVLLLSLAMPNHETA